MEINLSVEMIEKIIFVSAGRISDLKAILNKVFQSHNIS